jgi:predicted ribosomally synthesized peptide with nif11-like leader
MKEELKLFFQKVAEDRELQEKLQACKSPEEVYVIASSVQDGFTFEEFTETAAELYEQATAELSDEDLAKAAGGADDSGDRVLNTVCSSIAAAGLAWAV